MEFLNNLGDMRILDILRTQHSINAKLASSTPRTMAQNRGGMLDARLRKSVQP